MAEDISMWSETAAENATADPGINWQEGMPPSSVNNSARAMMAAIAKWREQIQWGGDSWGGTAGGTVDALMVTLDPAPTAYGAGMGIAFLAAGPNAGAATLNVNDLGAKALQQDGVALTGGELAAGQFVQAVYDGTQFQLRTAPAAVDTSSFVTLTGAQTLENKTLSAPIITGFASTSLSDTDDLVYESDLTSGLASKLAIPAGAVTVATDDKVIIQDTDDSNSIQTVTAKSIADLAGLTDNLKVKGWAKVNADGTAGETFNVSGTSRDSTGYFTVTWNTDFSSDAYVVLASAASYTNALIAGQTAGSVTVRLVHASSNSNTNNEVYVVAFGAQ